MYQWMVPGLTDYIRSHWSQEPPLNIPPTTTADRHLHEHTDRTETTWKTGRRDHRKQTEETGEWQTADKEENLRPNNSLTNTEEDSWDGMRHKQCTGGGGTEEETDERKNEELKKKSTLWFSYTVTRDQELLRDFLSERGPYAPATILLYCNI